MSTLLICLAVVGIVVAVTWVVTAGRRKPATGDIKPSDGKPSDGAEPETGDFGDGITIWGRARSGVALVLLLALVGALLAMIVLIAGAVAITGIRTAVQ